MPDIKTKAGKGVRRPRLEPTEQQRADIKEAFDLFDVEGTGTIDAKEVRVALRALGFEPSRDELKRLITEVERNKKSAGNTEGTDKQRNTVTQGAGQPSLGQLDYNDFLEIMKIKMNEKPTREQLSKGFLALANGKDVITWDDLKKASVDLGEKLSDEELREMLAHACRGKSSQVTEEDFFRILRS
ncbi:uncharacterized protein EMH_0066900 [Eimeria mitis]|uniref:EF-hand domain-containing protein n=1 Tax=Eimeria mitis TaxID=44415 RepID=U6K9K2_9EIME|nr:uncharacterized protein EMH_0066900 [Eimeria mitis]CDJ34720.1 hypothetical protein, conserved [Eimeria mitis]